MSLSLLSVCWCVSGSTQPTTVNVPCQAVESSRRFWRAFKKQRGRHINLSGIQLTRSQDEHKLSSPVYLDPNSSSAPPLPTPMLCFSHSSKKLKFYLISRRRLGCRLANFDSLSGSEREITSSNCERPSPVSPAPTANTRHKAKSRSLFLSGPI